MSGNNDSLTKEKEILKRVENGSIGQRAAAYSKLSGPGWLQSAITLGGGSLGSSLYLGVIGGIGLLWLQPFAMILGIIMLSAISYVTLSTGKRPFHAINEHINPVLGWSWALASLMANMVWCLPQYGLANGVIQNNIAPEIGGDFGTWLAGSGGKWAICIIILILTTLVTWSYGSGHKGIRLYEIMLKVMVAAIVVCFVGVVIKVLSAGGKFSFGQIFGALVPDLKLLSQPAADLKSIVDQLPEAARDYWTSTIVSKQRDVMISAAATAVGINMTFLLPYSLLQRKWGKEHRGLATFDLSTGMFIPYVLATSCVVIASANQFFLQPQPGLFADQNATSLIADQNATGVKSDENATAKSLVVSGKAKGDFDKLIKARLAKIPDSDAQKVNTNGRMITVKGEPMTNGERKLAAMLANRDVQDFAKTLAPLTDKKLANMIFSFGVLGMALSTITLLMLISGFVICEIFKWETTGWRFKLSCLAAVTGILGPFLWSKAAAYLVVPTSVFGMALLPLAYISFFLLMNNKAFLGDAMPKGGKRVAWNCLMGFATAIATLASLFVIDQKAGPKGFIGLGLLLLAALAAHGWRKLNQRLDRIEDKLDH